MKKNKKLILPLFTAMLLTSCSSDNQETNLYEDEQTVQLQSQTNEIEALITSENFLRQTTDRDKEIVISNLREINSNISILARDNNNSAALYSLQAALADIENAFITERDQAKISDYLARAANALTKYAQIQGVTDLSYSAPLYSYRFGANLNDFVSMEGGTDDWAVLFIQNQRYLATIRSNYSGSAAAKSTLVTPIFDFSNIQRPTFKIRHQLTVPRELEVNRENLINNSFKVMVSKDFDKEMSYDDATWERVIIENPSGVNYHAIDTSQISLEKWAGEKKVTIAFVFDVPKGVGEQVGWSIDRFELRGLTTTELAYHKWEPVPPPQWDNAYNVVFDSQEVIDNLTQVTLNGEAPSQFEFGTYRGSTYAQAKTNPNNTAVGSVLLYSGVIDLTGRTNTVAQISQTIKESWGDDDPINNDMKADHALVIALDIDGVDPKDLAWEALDFEQYPAGTNYTVYDSENLKLPEAYQGQKVRIGWRYTREEAGNSSTWQIYSTVLRDE